MEKQSLCLGNIVTNVSTMLARLIPANIELRFCHAPGQPPIFADRCNLEQVVMNLVVNARDALGSKSGEIFVTTEAVEIEAAHVQQCSEAREGHFVRLTVRDTGSGMDEATLRRIFEPFFTTKEAGKGTGMGLATVHGIVKQHDGWIEVMSAPGQGTTIHVHLPPTERVAEAASADFDLPGAEVSGRTVLLVEDDSDVRELVHHVLIECGLRVIAAVDGRQALQLWAKHRDEVDLLLTDMVMPGGVSGADLADRVLADRPDLPVVYSSGYSVSLFSEDRHIRKDVNYLPKPYLAHQLASIVTRALSESVEAARSELAVA
jgi:CheY-like chemotaxis protein